MIRRVCATVCCPLRCAVALPHDYCAYVLAWRPSEASILASIDQE